MKEELVAEGSDEEEEKQDKFVVLQREKPLQTPVATSEDQLIGGRETITLYQ